MIIKGLISYYFCKNTEVLKNSSKHSISLSIKISHGKRLAKLSTAGERVDSYMRSHCKVGKSDWLVEIGDRRPM